MADFEIHLDRLTAAHVRSDWRGAIASVVPKRSCLSMTVPA